MGRTMGRHVPGPPASERPVGPVRAVRSPGGIALVGGSRCRPDRRPAGLGRRPVGVAVTGCVGGFAVRSPGGGLLGGGRRCRPRSPGGPGACRRTGPHLGSGLARPLTVRRLRPRHQPGVLRIRTQQFPMGAHRRDPAARQQRHPVRQHHRRRAVRHHQSRRAFQHPPEGRLHQGLRVDVQRRQRVVEYQEARAADHRPGQGEALALAAGQAEALFADLGVRAVRQGTHETGLRDVQGPAQLPLARALRAHQDVLADARREERRLLERHRHQLSQPLPRHRGDVLPVQRDPPGTHFVQPRYERGERRLPGAGPADEGHGLAGPHAQIDAGEHGRCAGGRVRVAEFDGLEPQPVLTPGRRLGHKHPVRLRCRVHHLEVPFRCRRRLLTHRQQKADRLHRPPQRQRRRQERHQRARRQAAVRDLDRAEHQSRADRHLGDRRDQRPDPRQQPRLAQLRAAQPLRQFAEGERLAAVASEALDDADAEHALLDDRRQIADLVLRPPRDDRVPRLEQRAENHQRHDRREQHQTQRPLLAQQNHIPDQNRHPVDQQKGQRERQEHPQEHQIRRAAREQLARRPPVVEGHRQPLQMPVEVGPHRRLHPRQRPGHQPPPEPEEQRLREPQQQQGQRPEPDPAGVPLGDRTVDDPLQYERDDQAQTRAHDGDKCRTEQASSDGAYIRPQP